MALSLLKPSAKELEHGLELHRDALVAESYSLFIHAPYEVDRLNSAIAAGASEAEIRDLSEGNSVLGWLRSDELLADYKAIWEASGVDCIFVNAGEEGNQPMQLMRRFARYVRLCDETRDFQSRALTVEEIEANKAAGRRSLCLSPNGIPLAGTHSTVEEELRALPSFAQLGARMMHLTYNRRNLIGDGCAEAANGGLSDFGHTVVREMNRLGIMIDLAHTGWQTSLDTARASSKPVVISHSAVWELTQHIRCKSDEVIRAVVDSGGTIGITNVPRFLGRTGDIVALLDHIDYVAKKFGVEAVTIGTDSGFRVPSEETSRITLRRAERSRWESYWPPGQSAAAPGERFEEQVRSMMWTNWPLFTVGLVQRGYSDEDIRKIIGDNILRVARAAWATEERF